MTPQEALVAIAREYDRSVTISHMRHVRGMLLERCPEARHRRGVDLLILAGNDGVSRALTATADGTRIADLARRMVDDHGIGDEHARWAVETWALALGVSTAPVTDLRPSDPVRRQVPERMPDPVPEQARINYAGNDLRRRDFSGQDLTELNLSGADLSGADLTGANLTGADLSYANLSFAILTGANLSGANLWGAKLTGSNLEGSNLEGADLSGAGLSGANLSLANLTDAYLAYANLAGANLAGANLAGANLTFAYLTFAYLSGANLFGANFTNAFLRPGISRADLEGAKGLDTVTGLVE